ncbi:hypothetical protein ELH21_01090 [Rhizobium leguminosarum]|uniref:hypothetical protein n=1 Tax=Rhizobium leguminosarum TaxID=384 RepID=UPI00103151B8|nr:hypothetical protein [Rhizobium leguminosarum]TBD03090.1 hypothetical protein ELH21_01090 [Rhizobium leguminosarum]
MFDAQHDSITEIVVAAAVDFVDEKHATALPTIRQRLADPQIVLEARTMLSLCVGYVKSRKDWYFPVEEEAKLTSDKLKEIEMKIDELHTKSIHRYLASARAPQAGFFSDYARASLRDAIDYFERLSTKKHGRPSDAKHKHAAACAKMALETLIGRDFHPNLQIAGGRDSEGKIFVNLDAQFVAHVLRLIDDSISLKVVRSSLRAICQEQKALQTTFENGSNL